MSSTQTLSLSSPLDRIKGLEPVDPEYLKKLAKDARKRSVWWKRYVESQAKARERIEHIPLRECSF